MLRSVFCDVIIRIQSYFLNNAAKYFSLFMVDKFDVIRIQFFSKHTFLIKQKNN